MTTQIELQHSRWLMGLLIAMGALALIAIGLAGLPAEARLFLAFVVFFGSGWAICKMRRPLPGLRLKADGLIQLSVAGAEWQIAEILPGSLVSAGFSAVRLRDADGKIHRLTLLRDSGAPDHLRRLRVSLRWAPRTRLDTRSPDAD